MFEKFILTKFQFACSYLLFNIFLGNWLKFFIIMFSIFVFQNNWWNSQFLLQLKTLEILNYTKKQKKKTLDKKNIRNKGFYYNYFLVVDSLVNISVVFRDFKKLQILQSPFLFQGCHTLREIREFRKLSNFWFFF